MYLAHATPIILEIICLMIVGFYGQYFYEETLVETEILMALMLFAMGLQNGLTASISNFAVKTTHLTGATTELGVLFSMFTKKEYRENEALRGKAKLLLFVALFYVMGAIVAGYTYLYIDFKLFYVVSLFLTIVIIYDFYKIKVQEFLEKQKFYQNRKLRKLEKKNKENLNQSIVNTNL
jgi:uncharacterized membrane protein YoaK (UPF0700 family)